MNKELLYPIIDEPIENDPQIIGVGNDYPEISGTKKVVNKAKFGVGALSVKPVGSGN